MNKRISGYSLIEVLIASTIFLVLVLSIISIFNGFKTKATITAEKIKLEDAKETLGNLLLPDFENAGFNLTIAKNQIWGSAPAIFSGNQDYISEPTGILRRIDRNSDGRIYSNLDIGSETGVINIRFGSSSYISLKGIRGGETIVGVGQDARNLNGIFLFCENPATGERTIISQHTPGTLYRITLRADRGGKAVVVSLLNESENDEPVELFKTTENAPLGRTSVEAFIESRGDEIAAHIVGTPLIDKKSNDQSSINLYYDMQLGRVTDSAVSIDYDAHTVNIVRGDFGSDTGYIKELTDFSNRAEINLNQTSQRPLNQGDYCLVLDMASGNSALIQIESVGRNDSGGENIVVVPVKENAPAWGRYISTPDGLQKSYPAGSRIVRLMDPINYKITDDRRLVRQIGDRSETVAFNVVNFGVTQLGEGKNIRYEIEVTLESSSDFMIAGDNQTQIKYQYTATPKAANMGNQSE